MTKMNGKTAVALASVTVLATTGVVTAAPVVAQSIGADVADQTAVEQSSVAQALGIVNVSAVSGEFSYSQEILTLNTFISTVFRNAVTSLCASAPEQDAAYNAIPIAVGGDVPHSYEATVDEMSDSSSTATLTMGCTCASNGPGGGAVANAEVEGVTLESVYAQTQGAAPQNGDKPALDR